jgi:hypothetical protein
MKEEINMSDRLNCPRCGGPNLRDWSELNEEEKEVVKRLPSSAEYSREERRRTHRWCTRCWFESKGDENRTA